MVRNWLCPGLDQGCHKICAGNLSQKIGGNCLLQTNFEIFSFLENAPPKFCVWLRPWSAFLNTHKWLARAFACEPTELNFQLSGLNLYIYTMCHWLTFITRSNASYFKLKQYQISACFGFTDCTHYEENINFVFKLIKQFHCSQNRKPIWWLKFIMNKEEISSVFQLMKDANIGRKIFQSRTVNEQCYRPNATLEEKHIRNLKRRSIRQLIFLCKSKITKPFFMNKTGWLQSAYQNYHQ